VKRKVLTIVLSVLALVVISGFLFRDKILDRWHAYQMHEQALALMSGNQWEKAMDLAHQAVDLCPTDAAYQRTYVEARENFVQQTKKELNSKDPLQGIFEVYDITSRLSPVLEEDGISQLSALGVEREQPALDEAAELFDTDMTQLNAAFHGHENSFSEMFSPASQNRARLEISAYINLSAAQSAWEKNRPELTAASLGKVPADFQKAAFVALQAKLNSYRDGLLAKLESAKNLAAEGNYVDANVLLLGIKQNESWVPELRDGRSSILREGQAFYAKKIVESNLNKEYKEAGGWLRKLLTLRGQKTDGIDFDNIFKPGTTAEFLQTLASVGLHPDVPQSPLFTIIQTQSPGPFLHPRKSP
jgi:hypothetical protein